MRNDGIYLGGHGRFLNEIPERMASLNFKARFVCSEAAKAARFPGMGSENMVLSPRIKLRSRKYKTRVVRVLLLR